MNTNKAHSHRNWDEDYSLLKSNLSFSYRRHGQVVTEGQKSLVRLSDVLRHFSDHTERWRLNPTNAKMLLNWYLFKAYMFC